MVNKLLTKYVFKRYISCLIGKYIELVNNLFTLLRKLVMIK